MHGVKRDKAAKTFEEKNEIRQKLAKFQALSKVLLSKVRDAARSLFRFLSFRSIRIFLKLLTCVPSQSHPSSHVQHSQIIIRLYNSCTGAETERSVRQESPGADSNDAEAST